MKSQTHRKTGWEDRAGVEVEDEIEQNEFEQIRDGIKSTLEAGPKRKAARKDVEKPKETQPIRMSDS